jgi:hypothetical protein
MSTAAAGLEARAAFERARRASAAGCALWRDGLVPEGRAEMDRALRSALKAWAPVRGEDRPSTTDATADPDQQALVALERAGYRRLDRLQAALALSAPRDPAEGGPAAGASSEAAFDLTAGEAERLIHFTAPRVRTPDERRRRRVLATAGLAGGLVLAGVVAALLWYQPRASASGVYTPEFPADHATDGNETTEWLLPDGAAGWLQVTFPSRRRISSVVLVNAHNRMFLDRGTKDVRVTAFSDLDPVASATGTFPGVQNDRSAIELPLTAARVTHLRVEILSHYRAGGGLAEIEVR